MGSNACHQSDHYSATPLVLYCHRSGFADWGWGVECHKLALRNNCVCLWIYSLLRSDSVPFPRAVHSSAHSQHMSEEHIVRYQSDLNLSVVCTHQLVNTGHVLAGSEGMLGSRQGREQQQQPGKSTKLPNWKLLYRIDKTKCIEWCWIPITTVVGNAC